MRVSPTGTSSYSLVHLNIPTEKWTWLSNSRVGRLKNLAIFNEFIYDEELYNLDSSGYD